MEVPERNSFLGRPLIHVVLIVALGLIIYSNTFDVPFQFDDQFYIIQNPTIKDIDYFVNPERVAHVAPNEDIRHYFRTRYVGYLSFFLNYKLGGLDMACYHAVNLTIHLFCAMLVYALVLLTFRTPLLKESPLRKNETGVSLVTASLFVAHPVQTQAVTYISQRFASLAAIFSLLSLFLYIRWRLSAKDMRGAFTFKGVVLYLGCLVSAVLAMKSKETAFTLPVVILLYEFIFFHGNAKRRILSLLPVLLTLLIVPISILNFQVPLEEALSEATRTQLEISRGEYLLTQFRVLVTYLRLLFLPVNQSLDYDYPVYGQFFTPPVFISFLFLALAVSFVVYFLFRTRKRNTAWMGLAAFGVLWFFVTLSVESSVIPLADVIFEHRLYLPIVGAFVALSAGAFELYGRLKRTSFRTALVLLLTSIPLVLSVASYARNAVWESGTGLWRDVLEKSPGKARAYNALGLSYWKRSMPGKAVENYTASLELNPYDEKIYYNRGLAYNKLQQYEKAIRDFDRTIELKPTFILAYNKRGIAYMGLRQYRRAIKDFDRAIELSPDAAEAYNNRGITYMDLKQYQQAIQDFNSAITVRNDYPEAYNNRGVANGNLNRHDMAIRDFTKAVEFDPEYAEAYHNRGNALRNMKQYREAIRDFDRAIELNPDYSAAFYNRGNTYMDRKDHRHAIRDFSRAIELKPKFGEAYNNRGYVYMALLGDKTKACEDWKTACGLGVCNNYALAVEKGICK